MGLPAGPGDRRRSRDRNPPGPGSGRAGSEILQQAFGERAEQLARRCRCATRPKRRRWWMPNGSSAAAGSSRCTGPPKAIPILRVGSHVEVNGLGARFSNTYYVVADHASLRPGARLRNRLHRRMRVSGERSVMSLLLARSDGSALLGPAAYLARVSACKDPDIAQPRAGAHLQLRRQHRRGRAGLGARGDAGCRRQQGRVPVPRYRGRGPGGVSVRAIRAFRSSSAACGTAATPRPSSSADRRSRRSSGPSPGKNGTQGRHRRGTERPGDDQAVDARRPGRPS